MRLLAPRFANECKQERPGPRALGSQGAELTVSLAALQGSKGEAVVELVLEGRSAAFGPALQPVGGCMGGGDDSECAAAAGARPASQDVWCHTPISCTLAARSHFCRSCLQQRGAVRGRPAGGSAAGGRVRRAGRRGRARGRCGAPDARWLPIPAQGAWPMCARCTLSGMLCTFAVPAWLDASMQQRRLCEVLRLLTNPCMTVAGAVDRTKDADRVRTEKAKQTSTSLRASARRRCAVRARSRRGGRCSPWHHPDRRALARPGQSGTPCRRTIARSQC